MPTIPSLLLAVDRSASVIQRLESGSPRAITYSPFGYHIGDPGVHFLGFNGQPCELLTNAYLLGSGYRAFNSVLQRFNSPDSYSPFGPGGLNAYAYCAGDPVNFVDPSGHIFKFIRRAFARLGSGSKKRPDPGRLKKVVFFPDGEVIPHLGDILERVPRNGALAKQSKMPGRRMEIPSAPPLTPRSSIIPSAPLASAFDLPLSLSASAPDLSMFSATTRQSVTASAPNLSSLSSTPRNSIHAAQGVTPPLAAEPPRSLADLLPDAPTHALPTKTKKLRRGKSLVEAS
jgi:RHS repeat-associated protein